MTSLRSCLMLPRSSLMLHRFSWGALIGLLCLQLAAMGGALAKDTDITIGELAPGEGLVLGPTYDLGPTSLKFQKPATLTLRFKPADIPKGYEKEKVAITEVKPLQS